MIVKIGINRGRREEQEHRANKVYYQTIVKRRKAYQKTVSHQAKLTIK